MESRGNCDSGLILGNLRLYLDLINALLVERAVGLPPDKITISLHSVQPSSQIGRLSSGAIEIKSELIGSLPARLLQQVQSQTAASSGQFIRLGVISPAWAAFCKAASTPEQRVAVSLDKVLRSKVRPIQAAHESGFT
jgi:hypothetical protein